LHLQQSVVLEEIVMATTLADTGRLLVDEHDAEMARGVLSALEGPAGFLSVGRTDSPSQPLPREIGVLIQDVLHAVASGASVSISTIPREVTTSTAAAMLGISRPTLMKLINDGAIAAHKVGSHTRLMSDDVAAVRKARRDRERAAFAALLEAEAEADG
jgi:excisionase family DNA binding protein